MEFNLAMTVLHKISPPLFSLVPSQIHAIHHTIEGKKPMNLKQQIQVLTIEKKSYMMHTIENGFIREENLSVALSLKKSSFALEYFESTKFNMSHRAVEQILQII